MDGSDWGTRVTIVEPAERGGGERNGKGRKGLRTVFFLPMPKRCHFVLYEKTLRENSEKKGETKGRGNERRV